uniref:Ig-like domain-containing protein n=1 Tax=Seriola dumerili TaxID=41447 RepID=A0A3B4TGF2_SERDU
MLNEYLLFFLCILVPPTSTPIVAAVGDDVVLPCHLEPAVDASSMTVEWTRPDLSPRFVHVWRDGVELENKKHPSYVGRTSVSVNKLKLGDVSLKLSRVKLSDEGTYRCFVPTLNRESTVTLVVGEWRHDTDFTGQNLKVTVDLWNHIQNFFIYFYSFIPFPNSTNQNIAPV